MKIYYSIKGKGAIYCGENFGPNFGNNYYFHLCFQSQKDFFRLVLFQINYPLLQQVCLEKMKDIWAMELKKDVHNYGMDKMNRFNIEIDSFAFTKQFMKERYNYDVKYSSEYEELVNNYINKYLIK